MFQEALLVFGIGDVETKKQQGLCGGKGLWDEK